MSQTDLDAADLACEILTTAADALDRAAAILGRLSIRSARLTSELARQAEDVRTTLRRAMRAASE